VIHSITSQQYITDADGQKTGVILSIDEYERLLDDLHDLAVVAERRSETLVSLDKMKEWLKEDGVYEAPKCNVQSWLSESCAESMCC
jgi:hypothetical protein